ncbi:MAG: diguanylate cyclase [Methylomonas sp.]|nr:diguanylate cyclase [Methylomonas sp.]PPD25441.1 MAG: diguanylate cyclase [Methylomonas sp.]PPD36086.1 MAG: diguanylate cyclase [Methylomonas sp.]PPD52434.1 MAG: diguanylate cyclase [Methylomonas sp.]
MSFFKKPNESPDTYKDKYMASLDSQDALEQQYKTNQDLLCKTIIRLAVAVHGLNPALDPHLDRIRNTLKQGLRVHQLQTELQAFTDALMTLADAPTDTQLDASLLIDFLVDRYPSFQSEFDGVLQRYQRRDYINHQALFSALAELTNAIKPASLNHAFNGELTATDSQAIYGHLWRIVESVEIPEGFEQDVAQIKTRLQNAEPGLVPIVDDLASLLLAVRKHRENERAELAVFLATLTEELAEIGLKASGVNAAYEDTHKKRDWLDHDVTAQMADLQQTSATATQLEPLKQLIGVRLADISQQIQLHNQEGQQERENTQRELRSLMQKVLDMESEVAELQTSLDAAQRQIMRDPLTKLPNRLAFDDRLDSEIARCKRYGTALSLAVLDIDFFKKINDTYGHKSGDKALMIIARLLSKHCRSCDFVARYGGEEFVMLLPETDGRQALIVADKLRETVAKSSFNANGDRVSITLSCGISGYQEGDDNEDLFNRADAALYQAKNSGRNQCVAG